jgi:hypothetical protein
VERTGGLKLALGTGRGYDRDARFARVVVAAVESGQETRLLTDARGRLRYRLPPGEYRVTADGFGDARLTVGASGWTPVRLRPL